jgi:hypothetical protein
VTRYTNTPCGRTLADAEKALGPLTNGQKCRVLLDTFTEIADVQEAQQLAASVTLPRFCGGYSVGPEHQNCSDNNCRCECHTHGLAAL